VVSYLRPEIVSPPLQVVENRPALDCYLA